MPAKPNITKLHRKLNALVDKGVWEYGMIKDNDKVLIAVSGGADSMALLKILSERYTIYGENISLAAVYVDAGFGEDVNRRCDIIQQYYKKLNIEGVVKRTNIGEYSLSDANRENPCFLCSRLRRKKLFETAEELGYNKIAFGHHKDDIVETLFINMIWGREISTMSPNLAVFDGKYHVIRPLVFADEYLVKKFSVEQNIPGFDQGCPTDGHSKRQYIKELLNNIDSDIKGARENIFASMKKVKTDYLL